MSSEDVIGTQGKLLRAWQLAVLRFAVTRDDDDRMLVLAMAGEVDRSGGASDDTFHFFRRTTADLCRAISSQDDAQGEAVIRRFLAQVDNPRLRRAFEAAIAREQTPPKIVASRMKPGNDLWRGLPSRRATGT